MTAVLTPVLASLAGERVPPAVWAACAAALVGSCLVALDGVVPGHGAEGSAALSAAAAAAATAATAAASATAASATAEVAEAASSIAGVAGGSATIQAAADTAGKLIASTSGAAIFTDGSSAAAAAAGAAADLAATALSSGALEVAGAAAAAAAAATTAAAASAAMSGSGEALGAAVAGSNPFTAAGESLLAALPTGELYILSACLFYALTTVRLGKHAPRHAPVNLAFIKVLTLAVSSALWLAAEGLTARLATAEADTASSSSGSTGLSALAEFDLGAALTSVHLPDGLNTPLGWSLLAYSALGPGAFATFLQAKGQSTTPAAQAQVILSSTPIWSAIVAALVLSGEGVGSMTWAGGALILLAGVQVARSSAAGNGQRTAVEAGEARK